MKNISGEGWLGTSREVKRDPAADDEDLGVIVRA